MASARARLIDAPSGAIGVLVVTTVVAGLILGATNALTSGRIAALLKAEQEKATRDALGLGPKDRLRQEIGRDSRGEIASTAGYRDDTVAGRTYLVTSNGYGGPLSALVAVDPKGRVMKVTVLTMNETPGLGAKAALPAYLQQFTGKRLADPDLELRKLGGGIDAVTGATISSRAVLSAVREALALEDRRARATKR